MDTATHPRYRYGNTAAYAVAIIFGLIALILLLHLAFVLVGANPGNALVDWVGDTANVLAWVFRDMFIVDDNELQALLNYGVPAVIYLAIGGFLRGLLRRID